MVTYKPPRIAPTNLAEDMVVFRSTAMVVAAEMETTGEEEEVITATEDTTTIMVTEMDRIMVMGMDKVASAMRRTTIREVKVEQIHWHSSFPMACRRCLHPALRELDGSHLHHQDLVACHKEGFLQRMASHRRHHGSNSRTAIMEIMHSKEMEMVMGITGMEADGDEGTMAVKDDIKHALGHAGRVKFKAGGKGSGAWFPTRRRFITL